MKRSNKKGVYSALTKEVILASCKSNPSTGCLEWQGALRGKGYPASTHLGKQVGVHRIVFNLWRGPIPIGMLVCHSCDNPICCNPEHLFLGTNADNMIDSVKKKRLPIVKIPIGDMPKIRKDPRPFRTIAKEYGVHNSQISRIKHRQYFAHVLD